MNNGLVSFQIFFSGACFLVLPILFLNSSMFYRLAIWIYMVFDCLKPVSAAPQLWLQSIAQPALPAFSYSIIKQLGGQVLWKALAFQWWMINTPRFGHQPIAKIQKWRKFHFPIFETRFGTDVAMATVGRSALDVEEDTSLTTFLDESTPFSSRCSQAPLKETDTFQAWIFCGYSYHQPGSAWTVRHGPYGFGEHAWVPDVVKLPAWCWWLCSLFWVSW